MGSSGLLALRAMGITPNSPSGSSHSGKSASGGEDSMTSRTQSWEGQTKRLEARTLTASGATGRVYRGPTVAEFRRAQANKAHARIEECYRRGLAIPDVR